MQGEDVSAESKDEVQDRLMCKLFSKSVHKVLVAFVNIQKKETTEHFKGHSCIFILEPYFSMFSCANNWDIRSFIIVLLDHLKGELRHGCHVILQLN